MWSEIEKTYGFQESATPVMEGIIDLHNYIFFYLLLIVGFVFTILLNVFFQDYRVFKFSSYSRFPFSIFSLFFKSEIKYRPLFYVLNRINHDTNLEIIWTTIPSFILILIAVPSLALLYSMDEVLHPQMTLKAIGYQWYWSYEIRDPTTVWWLYTYYTNLSAMWDLGTYEQQKEVLDPWITEEGLRNNLENRMIPGGYDAIRFDSYMRADTDLGYYGFHRLLSTDQELVLPTRVHIRVLVTAADVLHSWAIPSLGIKIDAVPGRLNQVGLFINRAGVFYGQCSELCGANHAFMPITIRAVPFRQWGLHWWPVKWRLPEDIAWWQDYPFKLKGDRLFYENWKCIEIDET